MINEYLNQNQNGFFVDVFSPMICNNGKPCKKWFSKDGLHMNEIGYKLWTKILSQYIK